MSMMPPSGGYCTNCGTPMNAAAVACISCGFPRSAGRNYCGNCASPVSSPMQSMCTGCGAALGAAVGPYGVSTKSRTTAGILAILIGGIGIHKFYLGRTNPGIIMAVLWGFCFCSSFAFILPFFGCVALGIIGIVEGIIILGKSDAQFQQEYVIGQKDWF